MKVSDLAKEWNVPSDDILATLKSLKLKAKDSKQEVSPAVISVLKSEFQKKKITVPVPKAAAKEEKVVKAEGKVAAPLSEKDKKEKKSETKTVKPAKVKGEKEAEKPAKIKKEKEPTAAEKPKIAVKEKEKVAVREPSRPKHSISNEPIITLKPLARKKKKMGPQDSRGQSFVFDRSSTAQTGMPSSFAVPADGSHPADSGPIVSEQPPAVIELPDLELKVPIAVKDFAPKVQQKPSVVLKKLMDMGIFAHINQSLDGELLTRLCREFGYNLTKTRSQEEQLIEIHKKEKEDPDKLKPRAPVVTFMGHVDHGKTSLLDRIRKSRVADSEHGGITQHIGAYSVEVSKGRITFLDTPGHEAFTAMRARGAHITDLVVLVVAADEGIMPQTLEAIDHAKAASVPIIVAINKVDHRNANIDRVKKQLLEIGLNPEDWGGKTICAGVSALTGQGVEELLEFILLEAELLELKANPDKVASGIVVEAHMSPGKGAVTSLIIQSGTLNEGDFIVIGQYYGRVKAMFDDLNRSIKSAGPSMPVEILGLSHVPEAGEVFYIVGDEKQAREISFRRQEQLKNERLQSMRRITLEDLYSKIQEGSIKELNVIVKADVQGSLEALRDSLGKIPNDKIKMKFVHLGVGDVNASDVILAIASKAIIIAFHVDIDTRAKKELEKEPVDVRQYRIIYDAVNDIRKALEGLLDAKTYKRFLSRVEIRQVFKLSKHGIVAGCYVTKGRVIRKANVDILRDSKIIHSGAISTLKRFKDDVKEVTEGMECGISVSGFDGYQAGDIIEAYEIESVAQKL